MYYLGIDLGGTNIAAAAVDEEGTILGRSSIPTPRDGAAPALVAAAMAQAVVQAVDNASLDLGNAASIGIGSPGTIDPVSGVVRFWSNLNFQDVPLSDLVRRNMAVDLPIYLENDANAAALGEYASGAGKGSVSMVAITLGTGIGGGAVFNGKLYTGFNYAGMEVGHFVIEKGGRPCTCGRQGCFETYCSATALIRQARRAMEKAPDSLLWQLCAGDPERVNGRLIFDARDAGDPCAAAVVERYLDYVAAGAANLVNLLEPDALIIGGGISAQGEKILEPIRRRVRELAYIPAMADRCRIAAAQLGNDAGIIGAAFLGRQYGADAR